MPQPLLKESLRYFRHSALPGVELLLAEPSLHSWKMLHERYLLCGCNSVSTSWVYRGKTRHIEDGATAFMEPGEIHRVVTKRKPSNFMALFIDEEQFLRFAGEQGITGNPHFAVTEASNAALLSNLQRLSECLKSGANTLELQSELALLMNATLQQAEVRPKVRVTEGHGLTRSLRAARELLCERYNESVTLDELAATAALSRFHLVRCFTSRFGLPPHAYQIQVRIEKACRLLRGGMMCAETASAVGFADQSHLTRHFKKVMGVTPRSYAQTHR